MALTFLSGMRDDRFLAPFVLDGPINRDALTAWLGKYLAPTLGPGDIVNANTLGSHKGLPAWQLIRNAWAHRLFLPPYSPDLNPIEMVFAKLKTLLRKADERSVDVLWRSVENLLNAFTRAECQSDFRHAGSASV
jgi:transposase